jgi:hypothetical protein
MLKAEVILKDWWIEAKLGSVRPEGVVAPFCRLANTKPL